MLDDATSLLIHHVKRQTGIHKEEKQKIKTLLRQNLPDLFFHQRMDMSDEEEEEDEYDDEDEDVEDKKEGGGGGRKDARRLKDLEVKEEEMSDELKENKAPAHIKGLAPDEEYTLLMTNNNWYFFFRLHSILVERLGKMYDQAVIIAAEEGDSNLDRKESTADAHRLLSRVPRHGQERA